MIRCQLRNPKNAAIICERIAEGWSLRQVAKELGCEASAISQWAMSDDAEFAAQYAHARERRAEYYADEITEIADNASNDWMEREGILVPNQEHINRSRLRVDARKWLMSKMAPKKYGDKTDVNLNATLTLTQLVEESLKLAAPTIEHEPQNEDKPADE